MRKQKKTSLILVLIMIMIILRTIMLILRTIMLIILIMILLEINIVAGHGKRCSKIENTLLEKLSVLVDRLSLGKTAQNCHLKQC